MRYIIQNYIKISRIYIFFIGLSSFLISCGGNKVVIDETLLTNFNAMANPTLKTHAVGDIDCYIDYSFGMGQGMKATAAVNDMLKNFLAGRKVNYYKVGAFETPMPVEINSLDANFLNLENFTEPRSRLKSAIDLIVSNTNKLSIYITDFERVEELSVSQTLPGAPGNHPIDASAWAQNNFKEWINSGNQIDIFAKQYSKPDYWFDKSHQKLYLNWIYTIVFTPNAIIKDESLYKSSALKFLNDEYQKLEVSTSKHFIYNSNNFEIQQSKKDPSVGNANDNLRVEELIIETKEKGFEYYKFRSKDVLSFSYDDNQTDKRIINKLKITPKTPCFSDIQFGIKVYDVTQPLTEYYNSVNQGEPETKTDVETGKKDTIANKPVNFIYQKGNSIDDVFEFVYNTETKEIGIKLKSDFSGVSENTIYQVDIVVASAKVMDFAEADNVLKLNYAQEYSIKSLGESVKYALNDVANNLEKKVIYTLYIKIDK